MPLYICLGTCANVLQLIWIDGEQIERLNDYTFREIHFPPIPGCFDFHSQIPAADRVRTLKSNHPDLPPDIDDEEILQRHLPAPFPMSVICAVAVLSWDPKSGEVMEASHQHDLLERIWDEGYNERNHGEAEYCY